MKKVRFIAGLAAALMATAGAQTKQPVVPEAATNPLFPDALVTTLGTVYNQYRVVKKDPTGVIIRYVPEGGGIGMDKVPFDFLPADWQKRYNYDPKKAAQFDLEQKRAIAYWREKMIADEQANREKWARLAVEEEAERQAKRDAEAAAVLGTNALSILGTNALSILGPNAAGTLGSNVLSILGTNAVAILGSNILTFPAANEPALTDTNQPPSP